MEGNEMKMVRKGIRESRGGCKAGFYDPKPLLPSPIPLRPSPKTGTGTEGDNHCLLPCTYGLFVARRRRRHSVSRRSGRHDDKKRSPLSPFFPCIFSHLSLVIGKMHNGFPLPSSFYRLNPNYGKLGDDRRLSPKPDIDIW